MVTNQVPEVKVKRLRMAVIVLSGILALSAMGPILVSDLIWANTSCRVGFPAKKMPVTGNNFSPYCLPCVSALRTYGRETAVDVVLDAFRTLEEVRPDTTYVYGEIGFPWGGPFPPHRTHREGLSFDFMVPLTNGDRIPTSPQNRFGYDEEFDTHGHGGAGEIDFPAIRDHLIALWEAAAEQGGTIRRVYFAPDLQDELFATEKGEILRGWGVFSTNQAWVRHDDHYHVDFQFPCRDE